MSGFEKIEFEGDAVNVFYDHNLKKMALDLLQKLWFKISKAGFLYAKHKLKTRLETYPKLQTCILLCQSIFSVQILFIDDSILHFF